MRNEKAYRGQAATELAIFGAILIFVLGSIARASVANSFSQNQNFKAMRMALLESYRRMSSTPEMTGQLAASNSRNNASIIFIEDRLSPDVNKYGSLERTPYVASGSGSMTNRLFYPVDDGEVEANLPIMDMYINGQHFPFTTAGFSWKSISRPDICASGDELCERKRREWKTFTTVPCATLPEGDAREDLCTGDLPSVCQRKTNGDVECGARLMYTLAANGTDDYKNSTLSRSDGTSKKGAAKTLKMTSLLSTHRGDPLYELDLNRNGSNDGSDADCATKGDPCPIDSNNDGIDSITETQPQNIAWKWLATWGIGGKNWPIYVDKKEGSYPSYDVDADLKEETIYDYQTVNVPSSIAGSDYTVISDVKVLDSQDGDIDLTYDDTSSGAKPGLMADMLIYTFTKAGTYLQIKEGKLYDPSTNQMVGSTSKRNQVDMVQRMIRLSNDTHRFCDASGNLVATVDGGANPVEVCNECFKDQDHLKKTCFDQSTKIMYVRTRLKDQRGHSWVTDVTGKLKI